MTGGPRPKSAVDKKQRRESPSTGRKRRFGQTHKEKPVSRHGIAKIQTRSKMVRHEKGTDSRRKGEKGDKNRRGRETRVHRELGGEGHNKHLRHVQGRIAGTRASMEGYGKKKNTHCWSMKPKENSTVPRPNKNVTKRPKVKKNGPAKVEGPNERVASRYGRTSSEGGPGAKKSITTGNTTEP